ncbi:uncharacterized protein [Pseudorasbora parva]|uniref:uncharacterized protein n=1 Tax=Pseudorasbora parva TaxID=51549 RepID=UPI00351E969F
MTLVFSIHVANACCHTLQEVFYHYLYSCSSGLVGVAANEEPVSVKEGHSVTLYTDVNENHEDPVKWYCNDSRIASHSGNLSKICQDTECPETFRDRLKVDSLAGHLTITDIRAEHAGVYLLQIKGRNKNYFDVSVQTVPAAERDKVTKISMKEGESVTLDPGVFKNPNDSLAWFFNGTPIVQITDHLKRSDSDLQSTERSRDRLKLDHQTGSLTIMNIRTADSGEYKLELIVRIHHCHSITSVERFLVAVIGSDPSAGVVGIVVTVVLLVFGAVVAGVIYSRRRRSRNEEERWSGWSDLGGAQQNQGLLTKIIP